MFAATDLAAPFAVGFYRIAAGGGAIDIGDPGSTTSLDIDAVSRPQGLGFDAGASELKP